MLDARALVGSSIVQARVYGERTPASVLTPSAEHPFSIKTI